MGSIRVGAVVRPRLEWWSNNAVGGREKLPIDIKGIVIVSHEDGDEYSDFHTVAFPGFPSVGLAGSELRVLEEDQPELVHVVYKPATEVTFGDLVGEIDRYTHNSNDSRLKVRTIERSSDGKFLTFYSTGMNSAWMVKGVKVGIEDSVPVSRTERMDPWNR